MQREPDDLVSLDPDEINEMEERRISQLNEAGIDEGDVIDQAGKDINTWQSYFQENITRGKDDLNFVLRDQWTAVERSEFTRLFKPCMTFNKLYDATKKIVGEQRKNKPDLIVRSLTGKATQDQINLRADLVRTISYQSQNDLIYQTAFKSALMLGFGAFQICLDYEAPRSFNRIIRYDIITDPTMCAWDPTATKPHKGDGNWCSRRYIFTRDEFFATYPYVTNPISFVDPNMLLDFQWQTKDTICVCDQFKKEWFPLKIYKLSNGEVVTDYEWKEREKKFEDNKEFVKDNIIGEIIAREIPRIVSERHTQDYKIMHYRMIRDQIIDFSEWPSRQLPIPFVDGDSYYIEGRQYTKSFIHEARDAQKSLNYAKSEQMAELKNRRREQWIATPDNIIGYEQQWRNPELQMGALMAKPDPKTGQMPIKSPAWEVSQGLFVAAQSSTQDLREILGFSENEEMQGRDISGKARRERKMEGSMSAYVFFSNLNQAIEQGGRVVNDLLPYIVGEEERNMTVSRKNGKSDSIIINERSGEKILNDLGEGDFDVEIDTGPSFAVQKDTALEFLQQTIQAFPQAFPLIADLWASNLDVQFMPMLKDRLKNLVPAEILAKEEGKAPPPKQPNPQEIMMQMEMQEKKAEIDNKMAKVQLEAQKLKLQEAELLLEAQKIQTESELNVFDHKINLAKTMATHHVDHKNSEQNFSAQIAKILSDIHRDEMKAESSRNSSENNS